MNSSHFLEILKKLNRGQPGLLGISPEILRGIPFMTKVFGDSDEILRHLGCLSDSKKERFIRYRMIPPGGTILNMEETDKILFWLLKGEALVHSGKRVVARLIPVTCFGELGIIHSHGRTATIQAVQDQACEVLEIDWKICELNPTLKDRFNELLLLTATDKLKSHFVTSSELMSTTHDLLQAAKAKIESLTEENTRLEKELQELRSNLDHPRT